VPHGASVAFRLLINREAVGSCQSLRITQMPPAITRPDTKVVGLREASKKLPGIGRMGLAMTYAYASELGSTTIKSDHTQNSGNSAS